MIYGDQKIKQMARSILPSTRRHWARWAKKKSSRKLRNQARQLVRLETHDDVRAESVIIRHDAFNFYVRDRRDADKLHHFERWAVKVTKTLEQPPEGKLAKMRALLPKNLIGEHALSHLRNLPEFRVFKFKWRYAFHHETLDQKLKGTLDDTLRNIVVTPDGHKSLNRYMVSRHRRVNIGTYERPVYIGPHRPRLLRGLGDIQSFQEDLNKATKAPHIEKEIALRIVPRRHYMFRDSRQRERNPNFHPEWEAAMLEFVNQWQICKGDVQKVLAALKALHNPKT